MQMQTSLIHQINKIQFFMLTFLSYDIFFEIFLNYEVSTKKTIEKSCLGFDREIQTFF